MASAFVNVPGASAVRRRQRIYSPAASLTKEQTPAFVPGEVLVRFRSESKADEAARAAAPVRDAQGRETPANGLDDDGNGFADDLHGWDFFNNDSTVFDRPAGAPDSDETDFHGTHVSGIVGAAGDNGAGVAGVSRRVRLMPLKILGPGNETFSNTINTVRAYNYAKQMRDLFVSSGGTKGANVRVVNNSYGGLGRSQSELDAILALSGAGILFAAAAGNERFNNDFIPIYPASYNAPNVISAASLTRHQGISQFTNTGPGSVHT